MTPVFADTFFFLALINRRDAAHAKAVAVATVQTRPLITTAWVLTELADGLATTPDRHLFQTILADLEQELVLARPELEDDVVLIDEIKQQEVNLERILLFQQ